MTSRMYLASMAVVISLFSAASAHAVVVTFDSVPGTGSPIITSLTTDGFDFTSSHFHRIDGPGGSFGGVVANNTKYILEEAGNLGGPITMQLSSGGTFNLASFDGTKAFNDDADAAAGGFPNATQIVVDGVPSVGPAIQATFNLDGTSNFQPFVLPAGFTGLTSATFSGAVIGAAAGGISLDNINASIVPEPSTLVLLACAGLATFHRRRR